MAQILINHIERVSGTSIKEIVVGRNSFKTPQTIPKLQIKSDLNLFIKNFNNLPDFGGIALDLWSLPAISQTINLGEGQRRIEDMVSVVTPAKKMLDENIVFLDPNTEWYRYKYPVKLEKYRGKKIWHTRQTEIMNQRKFPHAIKEIFQRRGTEAHNATWKEVDNKKLLLSFVLWHIEQSVKYGANLIIPPAPLIDGKSSSMLDIAVKINQIAKNLTFEETDAFCSFYLPIHPDAFREDIRCKKIIKTIKQNITPNNLLILKFFRTKNILGDSISRARLGRFLSTLDVFKQSLSDYMAIMILDTRADGFAMMANGVDITCDPLGGVKDAVPFKKPSKGDDTGDGDDIQNSPLRQYGKYFHPETREFISISDLMKMIEPDGILPHDCDFCKKLHGRLIDMNSAIFPKRDEWNAGRRLHNFICRKEEDSWLQDAVREGDLKAAEIYLSQRSRGNKNLVDLLPRSTF